MSVWAEIIGECYTAERLARTLGWDEAEVAEATESLRLLGLTTSDGRLLYPRFQLQHGQVIDGLADVLRVLSTGTRSTWTWAQWLNTEGPRPNSPRNIDLLRAGRVDPVLLEAEHAAASWRS